MFSENLERIKNQIATSCQKSNRKSDSVTLIGVTKKWPIETVSEAESLGLKVFGENYVQEFLPKQKALPHVEWHFIGHLQSNKVKAIANLCQLIHSVDRQSLLSEIAKHSNQKQEVLIEINAANEGSKDGSSLIEAEQLIEFAKQFSNIEVKGIMTMPPPNLNEKQSRDIYQKLYRWGKDHKLETFSFGTSYDFEWAILEGSTHLRLGTILFGSRQ